MAGPLTWWANRKSRIGLSPAALKPPHLLGKEWWTTPPIAPPQPEHIEYVVQFRLQLAQQPQTRHRDVMLGHVAAWLKAARHLLHEQIESVRGDLLTTDGLLLAARGLILQLSAEVGRLGGRYPADTDDVKQAIDARTAKIRRERAVGKRLTP